MIEAPGGPVYFAADTGYGSGDTFRNIRSAFGPPRLALIPIGAYEPRWFMVDVRYKRHLKRNVSLRELKGLNDPRLADLPLLRKGNRLSIMPLSKQHWERILELEKSG